MTSSNPNEPPPTDPPTQFWQATPPPLSTTPPTPPPSNEPSTPPPPASATSAPPSPSAADWRPPTADHGRSASVFFGVILLIIGGWFFATRTLGLDLPDLDWGQLWPILLILVGAWIVLGAMRRAR